MSTAHIWSRAAAGLQAPEVTVEVHLSNGLPGFTIVGLPESTVREARERVRSALLTSHFDWPDRRITVNLAPAELPKSGGRFDLPIALGVLVASGQLDARDTADREFYGELGLDGSLRATPGILPAASAATNAERVCGVPASQHSAISQIPNSRIISAPDLLSLCGQLKQPNPATTQRCSTPEPPTIETDLADIAGQDLAKRALEMSAVGGHHLLMVGPPGAGKTLLASALPGLLPALTEDEMLDLALIRELAGLPADRRRPFRSPHHATSGAALIGGGSHALPGEVSLATHGVLFLDELPEFPARTLDLLRQPLEQGRITINRAKISNTYPAQFQLVSAMNPCPCGYAGSVDPPCRCRGENIARYQGRISGPLLDRIDLHVPLERQPSAQLFSTREAPDSSALVRDRVCQARQRQIARQGVLNSQLAGKALLQHCAMEAEVRRWFEAASDRLALSARSVHRSLRVARTLADLDNQRNVTEPQLMEALSYRPRLSD